MDERKIIAILSEHDQQAQDLLRAPAKLADFLQQIEKLLPSIPQLGDLLADVPDIIALVRSYSQKAYTAVSEQAVCELISALIYLQDPADLVPDAILAAGYLDDASVINFAVKATHPALENYRAWQDDLC